jgi:putative ABC transport system ATP-binding protein
VESETLFTLRSVVKRYERESETVSVFDGLDMEVEAGAFLAIMGPSGSGKTTLLNLLAGIDRPDRGEIWFRDQRIDSLSLSSLVRWRAAHIGFVFQAYNLLPVLTAARNVELPLMLTDLDARERQRRVATALELVGLADCARRRPAQLSGGQQQRVAIARAIVADAAVLMCDEPTGNIDRRASNDVLDMLSLLNEKLGKTIVMVTHDPRAAAHARRCCYLDKGRFVDALVEA